MNWFNTPPLCHPSNFAKRKPVPASKSMKSKEGGIRLPPKIWSRWLPTVDDYRTFLTSPEGHDLIEMVERLAA